MSKRDPESRVVQFLGGTRDNGACPLYSKCRERVIRLVSLLDLVSDINQDGRALRYGDVSAARLIARLFLHPLGSFASHLISSCRLPAQADFAAILFQSAPAAHTDAQNSIDK
jgi:hypothetical protein